MRGEEKSRIERSEMREKRKEEEERRREGGLQDEERRGRAYFFQPVPFMEGSDAL